MAGSLIQGAVSRMLVGWFAASGLGATGLTVTVYIYRYRSWSWLLIVNNAACTEIGNGGYGYLLSDASIAAGDIFFAVFVTAGTADQKNQPLVFDSEGNYTQARAAFLDAAISSRSTLTAAQVWDALTSGLSTVGSIGKLLVTNIDGAISAIPAAVRSALALSPITLSRPGLIWRSFTIVQGDDYSDTDDWSLQWDIGDTPDLTGWTLSAEIDGIDIASVTVTGAGTANQIVKVQPTNAETAQISLGPKKSWSLTATNTAATPDRVVTLVYGECTCVKTRS